MTTTKIDEFIPKIKEELNFEEELTKDQNGYYKLSFEDNLDVFIKTAENSRCELYSKLCPIKTEKKEELLTYLMKNDLFYKTTGQGALALDIKGENVIFTCKVNKLLEYEEFKALLEDFLNYADFWMKEAQNL